MPGPLRALLAAVFVTGVAWALLVPPFQAPDENSHFGYLQHLGERFELPGDEQRKLFSTEQELARDRSRSDQVAGILERRPQWSQAAEERWRDEQAALPDAARGDGGGANPAATNPPLYYLYEAPAYLAGSGGTIVDRLRLARLWSVLMLLVTAAATWLLVGELLGPVRPLQLAGAAVAGLQPMVTFMSSTVNPDGLLFALWSLAIWLGVRILKRGLALPDAVALFAVVGLAVATKASSYALVPAALVVLGVAVARRRGGGHPRPAVIAAAAVLAFAAPALGWVVTAGALDRPAVNEVATAPGRESPSLTSFNVRELGSYLWQFYLPRLPFQRSFGGLPDYPVWTIWHKTGWAAFGWLEVRFPPWVYALLAMATLAALGGAALLVLRRRRAVDPAVVAFLATAVLALLAGLHWTEFRTLVGGTGPFNQGRYLLPLVSLMAAAVSAALALLAPRLRAFGVATVLGGMFALQAFSLAVVAVRFYA